jgi:hypothetical protein
MKSIRFLLPLGGVAVFLLLPAVSRGDGTAATAITTPATPSAATPASGGSFSFVKPATPAVAPATSGPSPKPVASTAPEVSHPAESSAPAATSDSDAQAQAQAQQEMRDEMAEAERMANAALAAQNHSSGNSSGAISTHAPSGNGAHHTVEELADNPQMRPDYSDPTHHSMNALVMSGASVGHPSYASSTHHTMGELTY